MKTNSDDDSSSSDDNLLNWQNVISKRKKILKPTNIEKRHKRFDEPGSSNVNKFATLADDEENDNDDDNMENEKIIKPPPMFVNNVTNINKMIKCICSVISGNEFNYKSLNDGQVKLNIKSVDAYRKLTKYFDSNKLSYHTYQLKSDRAYRFVIKGLHHTTNVEDIKADLLLKGHAVRFVTNVKSKFSKNPLPMFYVDIDPSPNNKKVFEIREINRCVVQIEPPKSTNEIVQCHRCQQYGHTKSYCKRPFVCVKCGLGHPSSDCPKEAETPPRCVHCLQQHTASYRGCEIYQKLLKKRLADRRPVVNNQFSFNENDFPSLHPNYKQSQGRTYTNPNNFTPGETYANVGSQNVNNSIFKNIENLLNKQIELTNTLMNMMSLLINKLCK